ncbi:MAG TPA: EboA domain-containing protein [Polyangiaceae bacterium]
MADTARILEDFARAEPAANAFVTRAFEAAPEAESVAFRALFASVGRRLGAAAGAPPRETPAVSTAARPHWTLTDWIRAALVARAVESAPAERQPAVVQSLFEAGEIGEQESILRTLVLLPDPARFVETGFLGCRTNARRVFEAIACENAFPELHFPELYFNQMILKAIFMEVPAARIEGLARRNGPELRRMARDYASERRAAGRPVPPDIDLVLEGKTQ